MKRLNFKSALLSDGWAQNVAIDIDELGHISAIIPNRGGEGEWISGYALPGINNVHSHAFQRAMAGLAEYSTSSEDSFWTWRDIMYRFAGKISAEDLEVIASQLYLEMLKAGYISVSEFHYLHREGEDSLAMSNAVIGAARNVGIALCHLPVLYMASGFGGQPLKAGQKRFSHNVDEYLELHRNLSHQLHGAMNQHVGVAFHSLRAVPEQALKKVLEQKLSGPTHIHISEQLQEVNECVSWSGQRPVEWLYDHADVDENWCIVHATHLNEGEISMIATSRAVVGLCPTTEANLGDGLFPLADYLAQGGSIAIGSDSHISVSVSEELRLLEYGQRLKYRARNIAASDAEIHTGTRLYQGCLRGGAKASGFDNGAIEIGKRADLIVLDENSPLLVGTPQRSIIDRFVFNGNQNSVKHVLVAGEMIIRDYKHQQEQQITRDFAATMMKLKKLLD
jgi:formimidoylglutamate deiminase